MRMIQPVNALTSQAKFRGTNRSGSTVSNKTAIMNACGIAAAAGGFTTAIARGYTSSFFHAGILGICGASLAMFFMTPQLIDKIGLSKLAKKQNSGIIPKEDALKATELVKEHLKPAKKLAQIR